MSNIPTASRPKMQNYGVETNLAGLLDWTWADERLSKARNYWIASTKQDGTPHVAPVWAIWRDGTLYFSSHVQSRKARNLAHDPRATLHLESGDEVVILEGRVALVTDSAILARFGEDYAIKYGLNPVIDMMPGSAFYAFVPKMGLSWSESDFPRSATRWTFKPTASEDSSS
jgi:hypothetical protein